MRDLSIHITESSLRLIMGDYDMDSKEREDIIEHIISKGKALSCSQRMITLSKPEQLKQGERVVKVNISDTKLLANTLLTCRRKLGHRGIRQIEEGSKEWIVCKDIATNANIFCRDFGLEKRAGYYIYLDLVLSKVKTFSVNFLNAQHEYACSTYEAKYELEKDPSPMKTRELYDEYQRMAINLSGLPVKYINDPAKYVFFKRAKEFCLSVSCPFDEFLQAQFDGLEFAKSVPTPEQLVGQGALGRLQRYAVKEGNGTLMKKGITGKGQIDWGKIKRAQEL